MKKITNKLLYYVVYITFLVISFLPFSLLYLISDCAYLIVRYLVKYRLKVVNENLKSSFPNMSQKQINEIQNDFYKQFCDYFFETIKLLSISNDEIQKRYVFKNIDGLQDIMATGQSVIGCIGHYGNWEWIPSINLHMKSDYLVAQVYKKLKNPVFDEIMIKIRSRFNSVGIDKNYIYKEIIKQKRNNKTMLIGFIADQSPSKSNVHYYLNFLNHKTPIFMGIEKISKKANLAVVYFDVKKIKRGYYECELITITNEATKTPDLYITTKYFKLLEKTIKRDPQNWLWSHNRWKYANEATVEIKYNDH